MARSNASIGSISVELMRSYCYRKVIVFHVKLEGLICFFKKYLKSIRLHLPYQYYNNILPDMVLRHLTILCN